MPMGIVSDNEFDTELSRYVPKQSEVEIVEINKGRGKESLEVPNALRKIIGETSELNGRKEAVELGKQFGISPSSVSAYANGSTSTSSYDEQPNKSHIDGAKERISKKARNRLILALSHLTPEKLESSRARDIAGVAKDMSVIIRNMEPEVTPGLGNLNRPAFIMYVPPFVKEEIFDVIYTKE